MFELIQSFSLISIDFNCIRQDHNVCNLLKFSYAWELGPKLKKCRVAQSPLPPLCFRGSCGYDAVTGAWKIRSSKSYNNAMLYKNTIQQYLFSLLLDIKYSHNAMLSSN